MKNFPTNHDSVLGIPNDIVINLGSTPIAAKSLILVPRERLAMC